MDPQELLAAVEADHETELSRLGSSKALYAVTAGEMDTPAVLAAMAARAATAADVFDAWAAAEPDERAVETFASASATQREVAAAIDEAGRAAEAATDVPEPGPLFETLAGLDGTVERAAGLGAWSLVADGLYGQAVGFFVGSADVETADRFRELRAEIGPVRDAALDLLGTTVDDDADRERGAGAAAATIEAAYEGYVAVLEGLGIAVKPIC